MGLFEILKGEQPGFIKTLLNYENAGQFGEFSTEYALTNHHLPGEPVVLKNVYVPYQGRTSEIDLLMIHEKGIFVFESKNYSGWIFGSADQLNWTQSLQNGKPVWGQDCTHCMACICYCPAEAIEYGKMSLGKPRSHFEAL